LFRDLPEADLVLLAAACKPRSLPKGAVVLRQGEPGESLFVIVSGTVEILREQAVGRPEFIAELMPDDVFGEMALLGDGRRSRTVRATSPVLLLEISRGDFEGLVLTRFSREQIETAIQKLAFLHRAPLSRNWSSAAMAAFTRRCQILEFTPGRVLVTEREPNHFFYVVYEGELSVLVGGKRVAKLGSGDFFGEISLLQNSVASATILAVNMGRCLVLSRKDFLEFITRDFVVGLHFEEIGSRRLGRPLLPLGHACFAETG
jgi:CRP-like cAMP-binding protein